MSLGKKVFTLKTYGANLYKWSPLPNDKQSKPKTNVKPFYCNAVAYSQGQDWVTTYSYNLVVVSGEQERLAYVECGYAE